MSTNKDSSTSVPELTFLNYQVWRNRVVQAIGSKSAEAALTLEGKIKAPDADDKPEEYTRWKQSKLLIHNNVLEQLASVRAELESLKDAQVKISSLESRLEELEGRLEGCEQAQRQQSEPVEESDDDATPKNKSKKRPFNAATRIFLKRVREAMGAPASGPLPPYPRAGEAMPKNNLGDDLLRLDWNLKHDCAENLAHVEEFFSDVQRQEAIRTAISRTNRETVKAACVRAIGNLYKEYRKQQNVPSEEMIKGKQMKRRYQRRREQAKHRTAKLLLDANRDLRRDGLSEVAHNHVSGDETGAEALSGRRGKGSGAQES